MAVGQHMRAEDAEQTLLFVDMLGVAALTERFPKRLADSGPDEAGFYHTWTTDAPNQFNRFTRVLDVVVQECQYYHSVRAMLFSDCAFLEFGNPVLMAMMAPKLMRDFILSRVPVRMGIGKGTFYQFKFSTDITDSTIVTRSLFMGTAVVRAHSAEQCGGKGMRIFVHPSVEAEFVSKNVALVKPYEHSKAELDFLHEARPTQETPSQEEDDRKLFDAVIEMKEEAPEGVQNHYLDTLEAMNRMRRKNSRPTL
jgi:hypothetical protein